MGRHGTPSLTPRVPGAPMGRVRVMLELSESKKMIQVDAIFRTSTSWTNHEVIFKPF
jgi:hypothetical protein